jgi:hypothetical protein
LLSGSSGRDQLSQLLCQATFTEVGLAEERINTGLTGPIDVLTFCDA